MTDKIVFANNIQKALWENELRGQISDGVWENSRPYGHYKVWCNAKVEVAKAGEPTGRNFWAEKDNYNLLAPVEYVGDRMLIIAALAEMFPKFEGRLPESVYDFKSYAKWAAEGKEWADEQVTEWVAAGITVEAIAEAEGKFTMKQLRKELSAMKKIIRTRIQ